MGLYGAWGAMAWRIISDGSAVEASLGRAAVASAFQLWALACGLCAAWLWREALYAAAQIAMLWLSLDGAFTGTERWLEEYADALSEQASTLLRCSS